MLALPGWVLRAQQEARDPESPDLPSAAHLPPPHPADVPPGLGSRSASPLSPCKTCFFPEDKLTPSPC